MDVLGMDCQRCGPRREFMGGLILGALFLVVAPSFIVVAFGATSGIGVGWREQGRVPAKLSLALAFDSPFFPTPMPEPFGFSSLQKVVARGEPLYWRDEQ